MGPHIWTVGQGAASSRAVVRWLNIAAAVVLQLSSTVVLRIHTVCSVLGNELLVVMYTTVQRCSRRWKVAAHFRLVS